MFLNKEEIITGCDNLHSVIDLIVDHLDGEIISEHLSELSSIGASASLLYASSKVLYFKNKKDAELNGLYVYTESLLKSLHYKIITLTSLLKRESQTQFNNKNI